MKPFLLIILVGVFIKLNGQTSDANKCVNNRMVIERGDCYGISNCAGKEILPPLYGEISGFVKGYSTLAVFDSANGQRIQKSYDQPVTPDLSLYQSKFGIIDTNGRFALAPRFDYISDIYNDLRWFAISYINPHGSILLNQTKLKWGLMTSEGKIVIDTMFDDIRIDYGRVIPDIFIVGKTIDYDNYFGAINAKGKTIVSFKYQKLNFYEAGIIYLRDGKFGLMNRRCVEITEPRYDIILPEWVSENRILVNIGGKWDAGISGGKCGLIDTSGNEIVPCIYSGIFNHDKESDTYSIKSESNYGFINSSGKLVIPCIYQKVDAFKNGKVKVSEDGVNWKYLDKNGKEVK